MEDAEIIMLFWNRSETAISETNKKYGQYCTHIANNILRNFEDSEECINDVYLQVWNSIPDNKPSVFRLFLARITRNTAIKKYEKKQAKKRNYNMQIVLEELEECIPSVENTESLLEYKEIVSQINKFLRNLSAEKRNIFLYRYWYLYTIDEISKKSKISRGNVKVILHRLRKELQEFIIERGGGI